MAVCSGKLASHPEVKNSASVLLKASKRQPRASKPQCVGDYTSTTAAPTSSLLSCTWHSVFNQAVGDYCQQDEVHHFPAMLGTPHKRMPEHSTGAGVSVYPFLDSYPHLEASGFHFLEANSARVLDWNSSYEILNA